MLHVINIVAVAPAPPAPPPATSFSLLKKYIIICSIWRNNVYIYFFIYIK